MQLDACICSRRILHDAHEALVRTAPDGAELADDPISAHEWLRRGIHASAGAVGTPGRTLPNIHLRQVWPRVRAGGAWRPSRSLGRDGDGRAARDEHACVLVLLPVLAEEVGAVNVHDAARALLVGNLLHRVVVADLNALLVCSDRIPAALELGADGGWEEGTGLGGLIEDFEGLAVDFGDDADGGGAGCVKGLAFLPS